MDALDRLVPPARDLLGRVDRALMGAGAPAEAPIWPLLRTVGSLPGDALEFVAALAPDRLTGAADELRARSEQYARLAATVDAGEWQGAAADAFTTRWQAVRRHIEVDLAGQLDATAAHLRHVAAWAEELRGAFAYAVATVLGSAEAVAVHLDDDADAAGAIACRVLAPVAEALDAGHDLLVGPAPWSDVVPWSEAPIGVRKDAATRVPL